MQWLIVTGKSGNKIFYRFDIRCIVQQIGGASTWLHQCVPSLDDLAIHSDYSLGLSLSLSLSLSLLASSCKIVKRAQLLAIDYTCEYQILADDKKGREPAAAPLASFLVSSFFRMQIYLKDSMFLSDIYPVRASSSSSSSIESSFSSFGCGRLVNSG